MRCHLFPDVCHFSLCLGVSVLEAPSQLFHTFPPLGKVLGGRLGAAIKDYVDTGISYDIVIQDDENRGVRRLFWISILD